MGTRMGKQLQWGQRGAANRQPAQQEATAAAVEQQLARTWHSR
jgi:hypothetical protein